MGLSRELKNAITLSPLHKYRIARCVGIAPATLGRWMVDAYLPKAGDARVIALGNIVGVPAACCFFDAQEQR